ncbi:MAG: hypothetical protein OXI57_04215 [Rhodospirillales bacterium]|nr:hypothetical protein [Rhodospirillales bacterium]
MDRSSEAPKPLVYLVSCDLTGPDDDYPELVDALKRMAGRKVLASHWGIRCEGASAWQLRNRLKRLIAGNDRLLITRPDREDWACHNTLLTLRNF